MSDNDPQNGPQSDPQDQPVMPHLRHPALDRLVRENLRRLGDQAQDPALKERIAAVLAGRAGLRELAFNAQFQHFLEPLVEQGLRRWDSLSEAEQRDLGERGLRGEGLGGEGLGGEGLGGEAPSHDTEPEAPRPPDSGTW